MGVACLEFRGENFRGWLKNREIRESFLPRKFSAIRYYASEDASSIMAQVVVYMYINESPLYAMSIVLCIKLSCY